MHRKKSRQLKTSTARTMRKTVDLLTVKVLIPEKKLEITWNSSYTQTLETKSTLNCTAFREVFGVANAMI
jgi:hypothetical protein